MESTIQWMISVWNWILFSLFVMCVPFLLLQCTAVSFKSCTHFNIFQHFLYLPVLCYWLLTHSLKVYTIFLLLICTQWLVKYLPTYFIHNPLKTGFITSQIGILPTIIMAYFLLNISLVFFFSFFWVFQNKTRTDSICLFAAQLLPTKYPFFPCSARHKVIPSIWRCINICSRTSTTSTSTSAFRSSFSCWNIHSNDQKYE